MVPLKSKGSFLKLSEVDMTKEKIVLSHRNIWRSWPFHISVLPRQQHIFFKLYIFNSLSTKSGLLTGLNYYVHYSFFKTEKGLFLVLREIISMMQDLFKVRIDCTSWFLWRRTKSVINPWLPPGSSKVWQSGRHIGQKSSSGNQLSIYHHHHHQRHLFSLSKSSQREKNFTRRE